MEAASDPSDCITEMWELPGEHGSGVIVYNDDDDDGYCSIGRIVPEEIEGWRCISM